VRALDGITAQNRSAVGRGSVPDPPASLLANGVPAAHPANESAGCPGRTPDPLPRTRRRTRSPCAAPLPDPGSHPDTRFASFPSQLHSGSEHRRPEGWPVALRLFLCGADLRRYCVPARRKTRRDSIARRGSGRNSARARYSTVQPEEQHRDLRRLAGAHECPRTAFHDAETACSTGHPDVR
jgi:hypothetical protein